MTKMALQCGDQLSRILGESSSCKVHFVLHLQENLLNTRAFQAKMSETLRHNMLQVLKDMHSFYKECANDGGQMEI